MEEMVVAGVVSWAADAGDLATATAEGVAQEEEEATGDA
jgi:hypothetical protein